MRVTDKLTYVSTLNNTMSGQLSMETIYKQLSSGIKIQESYEDASVYIDSTRLQYELETIEQVKETTASAKEITSNSMQALEDMVKLLENFKVKVTQAATDGNSQTSREAIANELERIKENILQLANTSVNGQYLFSGAQVNVKPFDNQGNYHGDTNHLNAVTGSGTQSTYNIPGFDLFLSSDNDYKKQITTNVSFKDNRWNLIKDPDKEVYLKADSKWQQLIGQNYVQDESLDVDKDFDYDTKLDFPPSALYVQGVRPDGTSFKSVVSVKKEDTLEDVMEHIGTLYGNTSTSKVVDVTINDSGQIQITDHKQGGNQLDFHAVAFTPQVADRITLTNVIEQAGQANPPVTMDQITDLVMTEALAGANPANDITNLASPVTIQINGQNYEFDLHQTDFIHSKMTDTDGNATNGADYDNVYFEKEGNKVYGNVSQILKDSNTYATETTKLSEVMSGTSLTNPATTLNLQVQSVQGNNYDVTIDLANSSVSYTDAGGNQITFPIMHTAADGNSGIVTAPNEITYKQLNDIIGLFASGQAPTATINQTNGLVANADWQTMQNNLNNSKVFVDVSMDYRGRISVVDKFNATNTNLEISLTESGSGQFPVPPFANGVQTVDGANFNFSANNALTIDEPNVDIIKDLDLMIEAVRKGDMRANSEGENPRNTGMQGALERLDHLADHVSKQSSIMGTYHNTMENVNERFTLLEVNVQTMRRDVLDADYGEVMMNLMQTQLAYQSTMKASTMLSQLSLLNYM